MLTMAAMGLIFNVTGRVRDDLQATKKRPKPLPVELLLLFFSVFIVIVGKTPIGEAEQVIQLRIPNVKGDGGKVDDQGDDACLT